MSERKDFDPVKRVVRIRTCKNETSNRVIPLNDSAFEAVQRMATRADALGFVEPEHYLWCASQHHKLDPTKPAQKWDTAWRALRDAAGLPGMRFHDLRHTAVTRLLEPESPDHVVESITGHLSRRMLEHYSHIRLNAKKAALDRLDGSSRRFCRQPVRSCHRRLQFVEAGEVGRTGCAGHSTRDSSKEP